MVNSTCEIQSEMQLDQPTEGERQMKLLDYVLLVFKKISLVAIVFSVRRIVGEAFNLNY